MQQKGNAIRDGTTQWKTKLIEFLHDKNGRPSLREMVILISLVIVLISWIGQQFFQKPIPEFMFYAFVSMIGAGCFGYSLERTTNFNQTKKEEQKEE
jgi:hypothetical protein